MKTTITFDDHEEAQASMALNAYSMYLALNHIEQDCRLFAKHGSDLTTDEFAKMILGHCQGAKQLTD